MAQKNDKARLFEKWPDPIGPGESIVCDADEVAVLFKWGTNQGTLGPGRHMATDPDVEISFVRTSPLLVERAGGETGRVKDAMTDVEVSVRVMLEYTVRVTDASKLVTNMVGASGEDADDDVRQWTSKSLLDAVKRAVGARGSVAVAIGNASALEGAIIEGARAELEPMGLEITKLGMLALSLSEEDTEKLQAVANAQRVAKLEASLAQATAQPAPLPESQPQLFAAVPAAQPPYVPMLQIGGRVLVPWPDGNRYPGTIRRFHNGYFEVVWDNPSTPVWLLPHQIQPA